MKRIGNILFAGLLALLPIYLTVALSVWLFQSVDAYFQPLILKVVGIQIWGLGVLVTVSLIFLVGLIVSSVSGSLLLEAFDRLFSRLPIFKGLYRSIKGIVDSFNPNNPSGFKEFVLVRTLSGDGYSGAFLTAEFSLIQSDGSRRELAVVFIPSNHLYLGGLQIVDRMRIVRTTMTLQDGVTYALSAGASVPGEVRQIS